MNFERNIEPKEAMKTGKYARIKNGDYLRIHLKLEEYIKEFKLQEYINVQAKCDECERDNKK